ncbi:MAG: tetratricopeptide repeat protein [Mariprofundales bacterium]
MTAELDDLKRDMRSAKLMAWLSKHRQTLAAMSAMIVIAVLASTLWMERAKAQREAAATIYHQALAVSDSAKRKALLESVVTNYPATGYSPLALFQLVTIDTERAQSYLQQLLDSSAPPELKWQARLDLAQRLIADNKRAKASQLLHERTGKEYEQLRWYLLAQVATDPAAKHDALQHAADASSNDEDLKRDIATALTSLLNAS